LKRRRDEFESSVTSLQPISAPSGSWDALSQTEEFYVFEMANKIKYKRGESKIAD
jgi:hypothetical protein